MEVSPFAADIPHETYMKSCSGVDVEHELQIFIMNGRPSQHAYNLCPLI